ncbi:transposase [Bradyrhizobium manausense]|nr:transposase [Bradyrhizobium manausense]
MRASLCKRQWFRSELAVVEPAHTSQTCSSCGVVDAASRISRSRLACTH